MRLRYVLKQPLGTALFTLFTTASGYLADPKLIRTTATAVRDRDVSVGALALGVLVIAAMLSMLVYSTLELRYILRAQSLAASCIFLSLTTCAATLGHATRMAVVPPVGEEPRALSAWAYTPREALVALGLLAATGTFFTTTHNVIFLRKADYTEFAARTRDLLTTIAAAAARYADGDMLTSVDAKTAREHCTAALVALEKAAAADELRYRHFVEKEVRPPLAELCKFISSANVQQMPDLLVKACGLTATIGALPEEQVNRISAAYLTLRGFN